MNISQMDVIQFNMFMNQEGSLLRLQLTDLIEGQPSVEIVLSNNKFIEHVIIKPTESFYRVCNEWFRNKGVHLEWNNTKTIAWAKEKNNVF